jgi:hypothetical protein
LLCHLVSRREELFILSLSVLSRLRNTPGVYKLSTVGDLRLYLLAFMRQTLFSGKSSTRPDSSLHASMVDSNHLLDLVLLTDYILVHRLLVSRVYGVN